MRVAVVQEPNAWPIVRSITLLESGSFCSGPRSWLKMKNPPMPTAMRIMEEECGDVFCWG
jgi:hypothetical protein